MVWRFENKLNSPEHSQFRLCTNALFPAILVMLETSPIYWRLSLLRDWVTLILLTTWAMPPAHTALLPPTHCCYRWPRPAVTSANVMFCPNNYPEFHATSVTTINNPNPSSSQGIAVQESCRISVQVCPKINMYRSTSEETTALLCMFKWIV